MEQRGETLYYCMLEDVAYKLDCGFVDEEHKMADSFAPCALRTLVIRFNRLCGWLFTKGAARVAKGITSDMAFIWARASRLSSLPLSLHGLVGAGAVLAHITPFHREYHSFPSVSKFTAGRGQFWVVGDKSSHTLQQAAIAYVSSLAGDAFHCRNAVTHHELFVTANGWIQMGVDISMVLQGRGMGFYSAVGARGPRASPVRCESGGRGAGNMHSVLKLPNPGGLAQHSAINVIDFLHESSVEQAVEVGKQWVVDQCDVCEDDGTPQVDLGELATLFIAWADGKAWVSIPDIVVELAAQYKKKKKAGKGK
jgi:hypothetical protein